MRLLHTADWHLGKPLEGNSRIAEQQQFLSELTDLIREQQIDVLLIAGDVFDSVNPPAEAEKLFYRYLQRFISAGCKAVVAIAGNHDQPERMSAAWGLAQELGVFLIGLPNQCKKFQQGMEETASVSLLACGENWLKLQLGDSGEKIVFTALPYLSEARLGEVLADHLSEEQEMQAGYSARIGEMWQQAVAESADGEAIQIGLGHLYTLGGVESGSERQIQLGGALSVNKEDLPKLDYIALGHLHGMQKVRGGAHPCYYSGSPLSYSFRETRQEKGVLLIDVAPGEEVQVTFLPLSSGYPLTTQDFSDYEAALAWCEDGAHHQQWVNITIVMESPLTGLEIKALRQAHPRLLEIRPVYTKQSSKAEEKPTLASLTLAEKFSGFFQAQEGCLPEQALVDLFLSLVAEEETVPMVAAEEKEAAE
ncbi:MAG: exonuclease SbcCD subunit D [Peptococcaceae bacterium]|jgi:exonuclease SbcD|nr:exonuclease SbcCD subunit D [Peptococcaceae bacterium]